METNLKLNNQPSPLSAAPALADSDCCLPLKLHSLAHFLASVAASTGNTFTSGYTGQPTNEFKTGWQKAAISATHCSLVFAQDQPASWGNLNKIGLLLRQQLKALLPAESTVHIHSFYRSSELVRQQQTVAPQGTAGSPHLELFLIYLPVELLPEEALSLVARDWRHLAQQLVRQQPVKASSSCIWLGPPLALLTARQRLTELWGQPSPGQMVFCLPHDELQKNLSVPDPELAQNLARELLAVLDISHLGYLLKGWPRPELKAKGLLHHPAFGQLAEWALEDIQNLCRHWDRGRP